MRSCTATGLLFLLGCGPSAADDSGGEATGSGEDDTTHAADGTSTSNATLSSTTATADDSSSASDTTATGDVPCADDEYCFDVVDIPARGISGFPVAGDADGDGRDEVSFENWALDWEDATLAWVGPADPDLDVAWFFAPSPLDGVPQFYSPKGGYTLDDGVLVAREYPRPDYVGMPDGSGTIHAPLGPLDFDGDGRHDLLVYEDITEWMVDADTAHLVRFEGDTPTVVGPPLPARLAALHSPYSQQMAAADFDRDGRDEIVVPDDDISDLKPGSMNYDPELNRLVTLRVTDEGYDELWRAPAGLLAAELALRDFDGDGLLDLMVAGKYGIAVSRGRGDGRFDDPVPLDLFPYAPEPENEFGDGYGIERALPADIDGDGRLEIIASIAPSQDVFVVEEPLGTAMVRTLLANGLATIGYPDSYGAPVGDLDGNGCDDLVGWSPAEDDDSIRVLMFHR